MAALWGSQYYPRFTDEDTGENTGTQRGYVMLSGGEEPKLLNANGVMEHSCEQRS